ncbi:MAG: thermonuclease family protein [Ignavibacteriae bacterium]|nr:thermonuclease family protein [Ignavibacteriota bacterium]
MSPKTKTIETQNSYKIISGSLTIIGKYPTGDTLGFIPNDMEAFGEVYRNHLLMPSPRDGSVSLRFEGIDSPEYNYTSHNQIFSKQARDYLLEQSQFGNVLFKNANDSDYTPVISSKPEKIKAYIACNGIDPHGNPICYVFRGTSKKDGQVLSLTPNELKNSLNYKMLEEGLAYLLTYSSMPASHIDFFRAAAIRAKSLRKNIWSADTTSFFNVTDKSSIAGESSQLIYPKLFRRFIDYYNDKSKGFEGALSDWLKISNKDDMVLPYGSSKEVSISSIIKQRSSTTWFRTDTNYLVFIER